MLKIFFYLILFSFLYPELIQHSNIKKISEYNPIKVEVLINDEFKNVKNVILYYKSNNQIAYLQKKMVHSQDNFFHATIPKEYVTTNGINYYVLLELTNNSIYSFPYNNPIENPINIEVNSVKNDKRTKSKLNSAGAQILSPAPNARVYKEDLLISLSYFKLKNINNDKTKIFLNNRDITNKVTFYDNYFIYKPDFILDGRYNVDVVFFDKYNRELPVFKWGFTVISKDRLQGLSTLFSHNGKITNNYSTNNTGFEQLSTNNLNIDYRVNFDFLKIRNKFKISSESNEFEQDKNRSNEGTISMKNLAQIGAVGRIVQASKHGSDPMHIIVQVMERFEIKGIVSDEPVYDVSRGKSGPSFESITVLTPTALLKGKTLYP